MNADLERRIDRHEYEIETLKNGISEAVSAMRDVTKSVDSLASSFSVYTAKHDNLDSTMLELKNAQIEIIKTQVQHGNDIAAIKPVADAMRGLVWKITSAVILGGGGVAMLIAAIPK